MRGVLWVLTPALVLPPVFFALLAFPVLDDEIERRRPLLSAFFLAGALERAIATAEKAGGRDLPPNYGAIIAEYGDLRSNPRLDALAELSASTVDLSSAEAVLASAMLRVRNLPSDLLSSDPIRDIHASLDTARRRELLADRQRDRLLRREIRAWLKHQPPCFGPMRGARRDFPPALTNGSLLICGERVPLERSDVRRRILYEIEYLLTDFRESAGIWLKRKDRYGPLIARILEQEKAPADLALLAALESGYAGAALSPSKARGWWQFVKPTAVNSIAKDPALDWSLGVRPWRDQRCDLVLSTRSAARYLKWMRSRLEGASWLTVAAAYNAGLSELQYRIEAYATSVYWDLKLPKETEEYCPRWIAFKIIDEHRDFYGFPSADIPALTLDTIDEIRLEKDLPLSLLAVITDSSVRFIREINPSIPRAERGFRATVGKTSVVHTIHVPEGTREIVLHVLTASGYLDPAGDRSAERIQGPGSRSRTVGRTHGHVTSASFLKHEPTHKTRPPVRGEP